MSTSTHFYRDLAPFSDFSDVVEFAAYTAVPDDWWVMLGDIEGSTQAVTDGLYKEVNMIGAASITAILNIRRDIELPFVFGGDGGVVLVPPLLRIDASEALLQVQSVASTVFGLRLRVGAIPVADLRQNGVDIQVRKYQLSPGNYLAMLTGGGVELADRWLKQPLSDQNYVLSADSELSMPDLTGLSCRWEPLTPRGGQMLVLLIASADLASVIKSITQLLGYNPKEAAPVNPFSLRLRWPPSRMKLEARMTAKTSRVWWRYLEVLTSSLLQWWAEHFDKTVGSYDGPAYRLEQQTNTDFLKYDDKLRMVLDVNPEQSQRIQRYLEQEYQAGRLNYGVHVAEQGLMTCLVFNLEQSEHVHFIDGADGGFALAAVDFKARSPS